MASSKKILRHPDKDEIVRMLNDGESVRTINNHLKKKHPNNKSLWISTVTLQDFRKTNLNLEGQVLKDIQEASKIQKRQIEEKLIQQQLQSTNSYQEKINKIASSHLDVSQKIIQLDAVVGDRIEYWYNLSKSGGEVPARADHELRKFIDQQVLILGQYKKLVEGMADKTIDYNINVNILNDQISIIRDAIKETIAEEFGVEKAISFMDKLSRRLKQTSYRPQEVSKSLDIEELQATELKLLSGDNDV